MVAGRSQRSGRPRALFVRADAAKPSDHDALMQTAVREYGALHLAVNNAGIAGALAPVGEYPLDGWLQALAAMHPLGRLGEANEVAELVLWLCSDQASFATGGCYALDGGYLAQ